MLEKLGAVIGVSNLHIYAAMRGESLEDFQKTRNAPGALYSVAGNDAASRISWGAGVPSVNYLAVTSGWARVQYSTAARRGDTYAVFAIAAIEAITSRLTTLRRQ